MSVNKNTSGPLYIPSSVLKQYDPSEKKKLKKDAFKLYHTPHLDSRQKKFYDMYFHIDWTKKLPKEYIQVSKALRYSQLKPKASLSEFIKPTRCAPANVIFNLCVKVKVHDKELKYLLKKFNVVNNNHICLGEWVAKILLTELLWGNQNLSANCKEVQTIRYHEECFRESFREALDIFKNPNDINLLNLPSYIRINTLTISIDDCLTAFQKEGWTLLPRSKSYAEYLIALSKLNKMEFIRDFHISELLAFPPGTNFYEHPGYLKGKFTYQDKGSCLSSFLLNPKPESLVLDVCAAPGLKTNHLANIMENTGKIYAIDYHPHRFDRMKTYLEWTGVKNVEAINDNYMDVDLSKEDIKYILIDCTSSYSGIFYCMKVKKKMQKTRLQLLTSKQLEILQHCLLNYPNVKRVIYTVNSLYPEECEEIVSKTLQVVCDAYTLLNVKEMLWNEWESMSPPDIKGTENCLRIIPEVDLCEGYFIAVFERNFNVPIPEDPKIFLNNQTNIKAKKRAQLIDEKKTLHAQTAQIVAQHVQKAEKSVPNIKSKLPKSYGFIKLLQVSPEKQVFKAQTSVEKQEPKAQMNVMKKTTETQIDDYKQRQQMILQGRIQKAQEKKAEVLAQKKTFTPGLSKWQNPQLKSQFQPTSSRSGLLPFPKHGLLPTPNQNSPSVTHPNQRLAIGRPNQDVFSEPQSNEYQDVHQDDSIERQKTLSKLHLHEYFQNIFSQKQSSNSPNVFSQSQSSERQRTQSQSSQNTNLFSRTRPNERENVFEHQNVFSPSNERQNVFSPSSERQNIFSQSSERQNIFSPSTERQNIFTPSSERQNIFTPSSERQNIFTPSNESQSTFTTSKYQNIFTPTNEGANIFNSSTERQNVFTPSNERQNIFSRSQTYQNVNTFSSSSYNQNQNTYQQSRFNQSTSSYPNSENFFEETHSQLWP